MTDRAISDEDLAALIRDVDEATAAFIGGDMRRYLTLIRHGDDYTLMTPYGGEVVRGFDDSPERVEALERYFRSGEGTHELVQAYASGNLAVIVGVERQRGVVGDLPEQEWSLRVTQVFRREGSGWLLVHRHADPLTHELTLEQVGVLARGEMPEGRA